MHSEAKSGQEQLISLLEEGLKSFPSGDHPLRAKALARLAAARTPEPDSAGPIEMARSAIAMARRIGDREVIRSVLLSACSALADFVPARERQPLNLEHVVLASQAQDRIQAHRGHLRLAIDHLELGEIPRADAEIVAFSRLSQEIRHAQYRWQDPLLRALRQIRIGSFAQAQILRDEAGALAPMQNLFVQISLGMHDFRRLSVMERHQQAAQVIESLAPMWLRVGSYFDVATVILRAESRSRLRDQEGTEAAMADLRRFSQLKSYLPPFLSFLAEPCFFLGDRPMAEAMYESLFPHADRFFCWLVAMSLEPPVSQSLGLFALTLDRYDLAVAHLEEALARSEAINLRSGLARLHYQLALALTRRGASGDHSRAERLRHQGRALALSLEQTDLLNQMEREQAEAG